MKATKSKDILVNELIDNIRSITDIEEKIFSYVNRLEEVNEQIMDIEHFIEYNDITRSGSIRIIKLLKELRIERRQIKEMWEIYNTYGKNKEKLKQKEYREFLFTEIRKTEKSLDTVYNYRQLKEEHLIELNKDIRTSRRNHKKDISYNNIEEE